jgi:hypothetical protein
MGLCQFCLGDKKLIEAHIIPRGMYNLSGNLPLQIVSLGVDERPKKSWTGFYDKNILCGPCDGEIGKLDQHAAEVFNLKNAKLRPYHPPDGIALDEYGKPLCYELLGADPELVSLFVLSVIWRSHISDRDKCRVVDLGSHADRIRNIIWNKATIGSHPYAVRLEHNPDLQMAMFVGNNRQDGLMLNSFYASNFGFHAKIDSQPHGEPELSFCLRRGSPVLAISFKKVESVFGKSIVKGLQRHRSLFGNPWKGRRN